MTIQEWNQRYIDLERAADDLQTAPAPLLQRWEAQLTPGTALDLACGTGRNAMYLAGRGWKVTAVDGSPAAIEYVRERAAKRSLEIEAVVADLTGREFCIPPNAWDLILVCYYLQRTLFPAIRSGIKAGGVALAIVHIVEQDEQSTETRAQRGELRSYFAGWDVLHYREGASPDPAHRRSVAEIVARRAAPRNVQNPIYEAKSLLDLAP